MGLAPRRYDPKPVVILRAFFQDVKLCHDGKDKFNRFQEEDLLEG